MENKARGGKREGAGRKPLTNRYKEKTIPIRIPESLLFEIKKMLDELSAKRLND